MYGNRHVYHSSMNIPHVGIPSYLLDLPSTFVVVVQKSVDSTAVHLYGPSYITKRDHVGASQNTTICSFINWKNCQLFGSCLNH